MSKKILAGITVLVLSAVPPARAMEAKQASSWAAAATAGERIPLKLEFGFKNFLLGWTEILSEPYDAWQAKTNVFKGLGHGLENAVYDTVGGVLHVITFPFQADIQLPEGGTDTFE